MSNRPTRTRAFGLTQDPLLLPSSNDCHELLAGAAEVQERLERHCFVVLFLLFVFFSVRGLEDEARQLCIQDSPSLIFMVLNELQREKLNLMHTLH